MASHRQSAWLGMLGLCCTILLDSSAALAVNLEVVAGSVVDGRSSVSVVLRSEGASVGGAQNNLLFDTTKVTLPSATSCKINAEIGTSAAGCDEDPVTGACKTLSRNLVSCGSFPTLPECEGQPATVSRFRGIVAATAVPNNNAIPDGSVLYTCDFTVVDAAGLPATLINSNVIAGDPFGERLPASGSSGAIVGTPGPTPTPTRTGASTGTRTRTPTRTATPRFCSTNVSADVCINVAVATAYGPKVSVDVVAWGSLLGGGQNDILFDTTVVNLASAGACTIHPGIGTSDPGCEEDPVVGPCKTLSRNLASCGSSPTPPGCEGQPANVSRFRGIVAATAVPNSNIIPSGSVLYTCEFDVINPARLPAVLTNANIVASDPFGIRLVAGGADGEIGPDDFIWEWTPTPTPRRTIEPSPTAAPAGCTASVCVAASVAGLSRTRATIDVRVSGSNVGGAQNDLLFDTNVLRLSSATSCKINPEIGTGVAPCESDPVTGPCKTLSRNLASCGASPTPPGCDGMPINISRFRGIVAATAVPNSNPIPSGSVLYTCEFEIVEDRLLPEFLDLVAVVASDPFGSRLDAGGMGVLIRGGAVATATHTASPTPTQTAAPHTPTASATPSPSTVPSASPTLTASPAHTPTIAAATPTPSATTTPDADLVERLRAGCVLAVGVDEQVGKISLVGDRVVTRLEIPRCADGSCAFVWGIFSADYRSAYLIVSTGGGEEVYLEIVDVVRAAFVAEIALGSDEVHDAAASPDGKRLYLSRRYAGVVNVVDVERRIVAERIAIGSFAGDMALRRDGTRLYVITSGQRAAVVDTQALRVVDAHPFATDMEEDGDSWVALVAEDTRLFVMHGDEDDGWLFLLDADTGQTIATLHDEQLGRALAPAADGSVVYVVGRDSDSGVLVVSASSGRLLLTIPNESQARNSQIVDLTVSPSGDLLFASRFERDSDGRGAFVVPIIDTRTNFVRGLLDAGADMLPMAAAPVPCLSGAPTPTASIVPVPTRTVTPPTSATPDDGSGGGGCSIQRPAVGVGPGESRGVISLVAGLALFLVRRRRYRPAKSRVAAGG